MPLLKIIMNLELMNIVLSSTLSYFNSRKLMPSELGDKDKIFITPDSIEWNSKSLSIEIIKVL